MTKPCEDGVRLIEIDLCDPSRKEANEIKSIDFSGKAGIYDLQDKAGISIVPSQVLGDTATLLLTGQETLEFLQKCEIYVPGKIDVESADIPVIGQRIPTSDRTKKILAGMSSTKTPKNHLLTISLSIFGTEVNKRGIVIDKDSTVCVIDGGGRLSAIMSELNTLLKSHKPLKNHFLLKKSLVVQLNIDLSGERDKALQSFLSHNRDAKRASGGTLLSVELGLLTHVSEKDKKNMDFKHELAKAYVIDEMYSGEISGTILELFAWSTESGKCKNAVFRGKGKTTSWRTALHEMETYGYLTNSGISVQELPAILATVSRLFYEQSPTAIRDAHLNFELGNKKHPSRFMINTTLFLKVSILLAVKLWENSTDEADFMEKVTLAVNEYRNEHPLDFPNYKTKKDITLDKFWTENRWFFPEGFNSGIKAFAGILKPLNNACQRVLES